MKTLLLVLSVCVMPLAHSDIGGVKYPEKAERLRIGGHARVLYDIDAEGHVKNIRFVEAEPKYVFEREIRSGMRMWRFEEESPRSDVSHNFIFSTE